MEWREEGRGEKGGGGNGWTEDGLVGTMKASTSPFPRILWTIIKDVERFLTVGFLSEGERGTRERIGRSVCVKERERERERES